MKKWLVVLALLTVASYADARLRRGGSFVLKPSQLPEDSTFVVADHAANTESNEARKWTLMALGDTTEFTLYINPAFTDSMVVFRPPGTGLSSWDTDVPVYRVKIDRASTAAYAEFLFFIDG